MEYLTSGQQTRKYLQRSILNTSMATSPQNEQRPPAEQYVKSSSGQANGREVVDPITHQPITIHDNTSIGLEQIPPPRTDSKASEGIENKDANQNWHAGLEQVIWNETHKGWWAEDDSDRNQTAITVAISVCMGGFLTLVLSKILSTVFGGGSSSLLDIMIGTVVCTLLTVTAAYIIMRRDGRRENEHEKKNPAKPSVQEKPESTVWLNSFLDTLWPIVNPALFTSAADMLEDALQASLPKMIQAVRVADIGQGSEPLRILGIRWLDGTGGAKDSDRMEAEEGDFVNFEVAVAYRARSSGSLKAKSANLHLLMEFWLPGGIVLPVWVEVTGILASARVRIHLMSNPPFLSLMTMTLLGQPKVTISATPLAKNFLNVMDIPGLSSWIQRTINSAISEYVAPRSIGLDLKTVLIGRAKLDTEARGIIWINIKSAKDFKNGDGIEIWKDKNGRKGDVYVTASWAKWGKPLWSTRIIQNEGHPVWEEHTALLVNPAEFHSQENLKLQLWDADHITADDILGAVELSLFDIVNNSGTRNRLGHRTDRFMAEDGKSEWPGTITWSVGFFAKATLEQHLARTNDEAIDDLKKTIAKEAKAKLQEAETRKDGEKKEEIAEQRKEDWREKTEEVMAGAPPPLEWPAGILSVRIEQITGAQLATSRQIGSKVIYDGEEDVEDEEGDDLPSPYCTVIINHVKVYKTRTKMKSNNPYYEAGTEKFIKSWSNTIVMISVHDARLHEIDPLIGVVVFPLRHIFTKIGRSQVTNTYPLIGGMGFGRIKCSLMFRSVQIQPSPELIPKELLGWDVGTLEVRAETIRGSSDLPEELKSSRIRLRTLFGKAKVVPTSSRDGWSHRKDRPIRLAVKKRFASCLLIQFRKSVIGPDKTPVFGTLWLKDLPDLDEVTVRVAMRRNKGNAMVRGRFNASEDIGEKVGELEMRVRFWPGLSGYHHSLADQDPSMADVMEVLDAAEGTDDISKGMLYEGDLDSADELMGGSSSSSDSSDSENGEEGGGRVNNVKSTMKDYSKRKGELHRKHRGLMQWSAARKVAWVKRGAEDEAKKVKRKVLGKITHQQQDGGVEKEV
ncbi:hypothetical protein D9757_007109 [Collybiopsis confluens]|uniref:Uncharacterized protein n=1 Tax=Collybiopsis confluens TaxID=2823264 RepID=A0A8H5HCS2_9AGAR|nr:hypothetical protein D9757_007109 [Collybiopsis confluens]